MNESKTKKRAALLRAALFTLLIASSIQAGDWPGWRGPHQTGVSDETGLVSTWSKEGENLAWRTDFVGRATPVVLNGKVYVNGRTGSGVTQQSVVACFDAFTGKALWEDRTNLFLTTVPFNRVGWSTITADPETGNVYHLEVGGLFTAYSGDGKVLWRRNFTEEEGMWSGYGGRTHSPIVDEDVVILSFSHACWGEYKEWRHRYFAFDKRTGEARYVATPGSNLKDRNTYSIPVVAVINGQRLLIAGNGDGFVYAMKARTGEKVWEFELSKRGINCSVVVDGNYVYASHSEENIDEGTQGRVVCIDGSGSGNVTKTHEVWRQAIGSGYASPLVHGGYLYVLDNSANLHCLDAKTGTAKWQHSLGTVGKSAPVWADGKIYVTEVNGNFHILRPSAERCEELSNVKLNMPDGRYAEIYGSPAVAYGRIYFTTEEGLYCLGSKSAPSKATPPQVLKLSGENSSATGTVSHIQIVPALILTKPGKVANFKLRAYDDKGRFLKEVKAGSWQLQGVSGKIENNGKLTLNAANGFMVGTLTATYGELTSVSNIRVIPELPWSIDFEDQPDDSNPPAWVLAHRQYIVKTLEGNKVLAKPPAARGLDRTDIYLGPSEMSGYVIQADMLATQDKRKVADFGLISQGYSMEVQGKKRRLEIVSWPAEMRVAKNIEIPWWQPNVWYTMKLAVTFQNDKAMISGKVWPRSEPEPENWTITVEDPLPVRNGSPGLAANSPATVYFDNIKVMRSK